MLCTITDIYINQCASLVYVVQKKEDEDDDEFDDYDFDVDNNKNNEESWGTDRLTGVEDCHCRIVCAEYQELTGGPWHTDGSGHQKEVRRLRPL